MIHGHPVKIRDVPQIVKARLLLAFFKTLVLAWGHGECLTHLLLGQTALFPEGIQLLRKLHISLFSLDTTF